MNKNSKTQAASQPVEQEAASQPVTATQAANTVEPTLAAQVSEAVQGKMAISGATRQKLAEAAYYDAEGKKNAGVAKQSAEAACLALYQASIAGVFSKDECSGMLVDVFGPAKINDDGTPSKTPKGLGSDIRKRLVRFIATADFVAGKPASFFDAVPEALKQDLRTECAAMLLDLEAGESLWTIYDKIGKAKADCIERADNAFKVKHMAAIAAKLAGDEAPAKLAADNELALIYRAIYDRLIELGINAIELPVG